MSGPEQPNDDRMGMEVFDDVPAPDQWDAVVQRAKMPGMTPLDDTSDGSARRWTRWAMAAAAAVLVVVAVVAISTRADEGTAPATIPETFAPPTDTVEPAPTTDAVDQGPTTTVADTTTTSTTVPETTAPPSTTLAPGVGPLANTAWSTPCTEVAGDAASYQHDEQLVEFSTLAAVPALDLVAPNVVAGAEAVAPIIETGVIPGGFLVWVRPPDWSPNDETVVSSRLIALDTDGSLRWRRCIDELTDAGLGLAPPELEPETVWVTTRSEDGTATGISGFDLATGSDVEFEGDVSGKWRQAISDAMLVFGAHWSAPAIEEGDELIVVDTLTGASSTVPYPASSFGSAPDLVQFEVQDLDGAAPALTALQQFEPSAVYLDGEWTSDADTMRRLPPRVVEPIDEPWQLELRDGAGDAVWTVDDFHGIMREGFRSAVTDDVVLVVECVDWPDGCGLQGPPTERLVAYDAESGAELWSLDGGWAAPVVTDAAVILSTDDLNGDGTTGDFGYAQHDIVTGERLEATPEAPGTWPEGAFTQECCAADLYVHVGRTGAVVVATDQDRVRIWLPPGLTDATTSVDLAS